MRYRALVIANWDYAPEGGYPRLNGPRHDAEAIREALEHEEFGLFGDVEVRTNLKWAELRKELGAFLRDATPDDNLLLYYSGHGDRISGGRLALCGVDTETQSLDETSFSSAELRDWLSRFNRAASTMLVLDCCYSGAFKGGAVTDVDLSESLGQGTMVLACGGTEPARDAPSAGDASPFTAALAHVLVDPALIGDAEGYLTADTVFDQLVRYEPALRPQPTRNIQMKGTFPLARRAVPAAEVRAPLTSFHEWTDDELENVPLVFFRGSVASTGDANHVESRDLDSFGDYRGMALLHLAQLADALLRSERYDADDWVQASLRTTWRCIGNQLFETGLPKGVRERLRAFDAPAGVNRLLKLRLLFEDDAVEAYPWEYLQRDAAASPDRAKGEPALGLMRGLLVERVVRRDGPATLGSRVQGPANVGILTSYRGVVGSAMRTIADGLGAMPELDVVFDLPYGESHWPTFTKAISHAPKILLISAPLRRTEEGVEIGFRPYNDADADWHPADDLIDVLGGNPRFGAVLLITFAASPGRDVMCCTNELAGLLAKAGVGPVAFVCHAPQYAKHVTNLGDTTFPILFVDALTQGKRFDHAVYYAKETAMLRGAAESRRPFGVPGYYVIEPRSVPAADSGRATGTARAPAAAPSSAPGRAGP